MPRSLSPINQATTYIHIYNVYNDILDEGAQGVGDGLAGLLVMPG